MAEIIQHVVAQDCSTTAGSFVPSNLVFLAESLADREGWANSIVRSGERAATLRCGFHNRMLAHREREREGENHRLKPVPLSGIEP
jgi:hypothetical protein